MNLIYSGAILREHVESGYKDFGKVVHVSTDGLEYWWIPLPEIQSRDNEDSAAETKGKGGGRVRHYIKKPRQNAVKEAESLAARELLSTVGFQPPHFWSLTDSQLAEAQSSAGLMRRSRRQLPRWVALRDCAWEVILPIIEYAAEHGTTLGMMLEDGSIFEQAASRADDLGLDNCISIEQHLFRYMLGDCEKNALLPNWANCGLPGTTKFCKTKTGRPNKVAAEDLDKTELRGHNCTERDRRQLHAGWKRYKKPDVSVHKAYIATMEEYYAVSVTYVGPGKKEVVLLPVNQRPTEAEFKDHGPRGVPELAASRINLGEIRYQQEKRPLKGKARDSIIAVGQVGWLDSTPEDQNLVSAASRLKLLPTSHRTMIVEARTEYILGIYAGFEKSSTMTGYLAYLHAASSKVAWCARQGVTITEDDWYAFAPRRIRGDNGDLKSDDGIETLSASEVSLEVVRAWWASHKGPVEAKHKVLHRDADHLSAGTSHGRQRRRGESRADDQACLTFAEKMPTLINRILWHNNEELVPHLLTIEMRSDPSCPELAQKPTRKAIFKWEVDNGYLVSQPTNLELLKAKCLPRFKARTDGGCIRIFDPRQTKTRLIPELEYWSQWLHDSGSTTRGRKGVIPCEVHLDPTYPSEAWLSLEGMHRLALRTEDPLMQEVTLCDWLQITDDDSLIKFLQRDKKENSEATHLASARTANEEAQAAKDAELANTPDVPTKKVRRSNKRQNVVDELQRERDIRIGTANLGPPPDEFTITGTSDDDYIDIEDDPLMQRVRKAAAT